MTNSLLSEVNFSLVFILFLRTSWSKLVVAFCYQASS